jgi:uncharacterized protein
MRRTFGAACLFCLIVWLIAVGSLWAAQSHLVFMTGLSRKYTAPLDPAIFHSQQIPAADGLMLNAVALTHDSDPERYWILYCPPAGASTQVKHIQGQLKSLWELGYNVLAFDYRGFGANPGAPTEEGLYADASSAHSYLRTRQIPSSRIILTGRSLGSAVAVDLATREDAAGLLLFAPIDSVPSVATRLYPWAPVRWLAHYNFDTRTKASHLDAPVVVIYGFGDHMMPLSAARSLLENFRGPRLMVVTAGGHYQSGATSTPAVYKALMKFWPPPGRKPTTAAP